MSAYADLVGLAERAATLTTIRGEGRPASWAVRADEATYRKAAVLMLFGALDNVPAISNKPLVSADLDVLLIERAATLNDHPGQVAFPGGGVDATDDSIVAAALREGQEETGLDPSGVEILGTLRFNDTPSRETISTISALSLTWSIVVLSIIGFLLGKNVIQGQYFRAEIINFPARDSYRHYHIKGCVFADGVSANIKKVAHFFDAILPVEVNIRLFPCHNHIRL